VKKIRRKTLARCVLTEEEVLMG